MNVIFKSVATVAAALAVTLAGQTAAPPHSPATSTGGTHVGAYALQGSQGWDTPRGDWAGAVTPGGPNIPANPKRDKPQSYEHRDAAGLDCHARAGQVQVQDCVYGDPGGDLDVFLVGSSKSATYLEPLEVVGAREGWAVHAMTKSAAPYTPGVGSAEARQFSDAVLAEIAAEQPDIVALVASPSAYFDYSGPRFSNIVDATLDAGVGHVLLLWDPPTSEVSDLEAQAMQLAEKNDDVTWVSIEDWVCQGQTCPGHIGGVTVNGSGSHMTATYAGTLANPLHARLHTAGLAQSHPDQVQRIAGDDRYETAARIATDGRDHNTVRRTYIASGEDYPDALAAAAAAGPHARLLITRETHLKGAARSALSELGGGDNRVILVGGRLSDQVEQDIRAQGVLTVDRIAGADRYETAALLAAEQHNIERVYLASGQNFPDALAAGSVAGQGDALLLTRGDRLTKVTAAALAALAPAEVVVVGGGSVVEQVVMDSVKDVLPGADVVRVAGDNRYETAADLAEQYGTGTSLFVASGVDFPDALAAGQGHSWYDAGPVLLTRPDRLPAVSGRAVTDIAPQHAVVVGGTTAVSVGVEDQLRASMAR